MDKLNNKICDFLKGLKIEYFKAEYDLKIVQSYIDYLWKNIKPKGNILNMGIMDKTPGNIKYLINSKIVNKIIHIELDNPRKVGITDKEEVVWQKDFYKFLKEQYKNKIFFNGIVMWHGPEHMTKEKGIKTIKYALSVAKNWVVVACPWDRLKGWKNQPKGKEHLGHKSVWTEEDFLDLGFRVMSSGIRGVHPGHLIAWKKVCE